MVAVGEVVVIELFGLVKEGRIEVVEDVLGQLASLLFFGDASEANFPVDFPDEGDAIAEGVGLADAFNYGVFGKTAVDGVVRLLVVAAERAAAGGDNAGEAGAVEEEAGESALADGGGGSGFVTLPFFNGDVELVDLVDEPVDVGFREDGSPEGVDEWVPFDETDGVDTAVVEELEGDAGAAGKGFDVEAGLEVVGLQDAGDVFGESALGAGVAERADDGCHLDSKLVMALGNGRLAG